MAASALLACGAIAIYQLHHGDLLIECDYSAYGNPPVLYKYEWYKKRITLLKQGDVAILSKFPAEEIDSKIIWIEGRFSSGELDKRSMIYTSRDRDNGKTVEMSQCKRK
jgi:hypothetical protein